MFALTTRDKLLRTGNRLLCRIVVALFVITAALLAAPSPLCAATIQLRSESWRFPAATAAHSTLSDQVPQAEFAAPAQASDGFTIKLAVELGAFEGEKTILEIPDVLCVRLRQHDPRDRARQNYPAFPLPDGSVPVFEAALQLRDPRGGEVREMAIGIPLGLLERPAGAHEVVLHFSGPRWTLYVDGRLLDNDFPLGYPPWAASNCWRLDPAHVSQAALFVPALAAESRPAPAATTAVQYWTPPGHNSWVGDVATLYHGGRYHVFYLYDRRHHASKFGKGAHYFEHLSTADFQTWIEHEAATPLEEQWECIGTGTPFVDGGRLHLAYGLHSERIFADQDTIRPALLRHIDEHGISPVLDRTAPGYPAGSTYSTSQDGVARFTKSWKFFHPARNPSVYRDPGGKLRLLANHGARGMWEADSLDSGWRCLNRDFPPGGDCTFFFRWGEVDYIIGGFRNLWFKPAGADDTAYQDVVQQGLDFYDGLNVPAISEIPGGRFLMAAWIPIRGWGGPLVIRELLQYPDGRIGLKWMPELVPATQGPVTLARQLAAAQTFAVPGTSFRLDLLVKPGGARRGQLGVTFLPAQGAANAAELQIDLDRLRAQFGPGAEQGRAPRQKSNREGGDVRGARDYAVEQLRGVDQPFSCSVFVVQTAKLGGALLDAEIAGQRTMISYRPDLTVGRLSFRAEDVELNNVQIAPLKDLASPKPAP